MSEKKKIIITIARQYGSGGADTGKKLAEDLGISFYDTGPRRRKMPSWPTC